MPLPDPKTGLVIRYAYLWRSEAMEGREEGSKDRPCVVVLAVKREGDVTRVVVAPITHSPPRDQPRIEIPAETKKRLRLDDERSWIVTNEVNVFDWPGPDIRPVRSGEPEEGFVYGFLPTGLAQAMLDAVRLEMQRDKSRAITRDTDDGYSR